MGLKSRELCRRPQGAHLVAQAQPKHREDAIPRKAYVEKLTSKAEFLLLVEQMKKKGARRTGCS